ncbi:MAG TPA: DMT family transporter [Candidatus Paceibacterota bacterium]
MSKATRAYLNAGAAILFWASTPGVVKLLLRDIGSIELAFYSLAFSVATLFVIVVAQGKLPLLAQYKKGDYVRFSYMGVLGCYLYYIFLFGAIKYAPAQEAFIVNYLWPIAVVMWAALILKEKITPKKLLGLCLSFAGVYVVVTHGELLGFTFSNTLGDILAICGAVTFGLFSVLGKKHNDEKVTSLFLYYCIGFTLFFVTVISFFSLEAVSLTQLLGLAWVGVTTNALAYVFWFRALEDGDTAVMANVAFLTPFISLIYIYFLVGEKILASSVIGLLCIVAGIAIQSLRPKLDT